MPCDAGTIARLEAQVQQLRVENDRLRLFCVEAANHLYTKQDIDRIREMAVALTKGAEERI